MKSVQDLINLNFHFPGLAAIDPVGDKTPVVFVKIGPDQLMIGCGYIEGINLIPGKKLKMAFMVQRGRERLNTGDNPELEHEPVGVPFKMFFREHSPQVQVTGGQFHAGFFPGLPYGALKRAFTAIHFKFPPGWAPLVFIGRIFPADHKEAILVVPDKEEGGYLEREGG